MENGDITIPDYKTQNMSKFILRCWFLANLLHPVILFLFFLKDELFSWNDLGLLLVYFVPFLLLSLLCSVPALFLCFPFVQLIRASGMVLKSKLIAWILMISLISCLNAIGVYAFFLQEFSLSEIFDFIKNAPEMVFSPVIAGVVASLLCIRRFSTAVEPDTSQFILINNTRVASEQGDPGEENKINNNNSGNEG